MPGAMDVDRRKRLPAFPSLDIGIAAALVAGILALLLRMSVTMRRTRVI